MQHAQRAALDLSSNIALTAAAGSGKTTVLIERFLQILRNNGYRPEEVVAITFTEEAARQKFYEERLRLQGIPFQTIGGTGFYRRQEVLDLLNLLRFLHRPQNRSEFHVPRSTVHGPRLASKPERERELPQRKTRIEKRGTV